MGRKGQASLSANRIPVYWGSLPVAPTRKSSWQACPVSMHTHVQSVYTLPAQTQGHSPFRYEHAMCTHTPAGYHQHHGCDLSPSLGTHSPITVTHLQSTRTVWRQARSSDHSLATPTYGESWQSLASAHTKQLSIIRNFYASKSKDSLSPSFQAWLEQSETVSTIQTMSQHQ